MLQCSEWLSFQTWTDTLGVESLQTSADQPYAEKLEQEPDSGEEEKAGSAKFELSLEAEGGDMLMPEEMEISTPVEDEVEEEEEEKVLNDKDECALERLDSVSSVQIEPSYHPEEELIYEGDIENETMAVDLHPPTATIAEEAHDELEVHCPIPDFDSETDKKTTGHQKTAKSSSVKSQSKSRSSAPAPSKSRGSQKIVAPSVPAPEIGGDGTRFV